MPDPQTPEEELIAACRSLPPQDQAALILVAQYLAKKPPGEKISQEVIEQLFESAKKLQ
jgi:hypothetical protein